MNLVYLIEIDRIHAVDWNCIAIPIDRDSLYSPVAACTRSPGPTPRLTGLGPYPTFFAHERQGGDRTERIGKARPVAPDPQRERGPYTVHRLLERFGSASAALRALPDLARRGGRSRAIKVFPLAAAEREIAALDEIGAVLVALGEPAYPPLLAQIVTGAKSPGDFAF